MEPEFFAMVTFQIEFQSECLLVFELSRNCDSSDVLVEKADPSRAR